MADSRVGPEARAKLALIWSALMDALESGEPIGDILEIAGLSRGALRAYRVESPALDKEWSIAREAGADAYADRINAIVNSPVTDANVARVRVQALQWLASKRNPRVYSDKTQIDMNIKTVDLTQIINAANARLAAARAPRIIEGEVMRDSITDATQQSALKVISSLDTLM